jgi:hypothetical protein
MMAVFDWNAYLTLSEELSTRSDEAALRTAISRAYYFVYQTAKRREAVKQYRFSNEGKSHDDLWELYDRNTSQECKRLARIGKRLKLRRVDADYSAYYPRIEEDITTVLQDAKDCAAILVALDPKYPEPVPKMWSAR